MEKKKIVVPIGDKELIFETGGYGTSGQWVGIGQAGGDGSICRCLL